MSDYALQVDNAHRLLVENYCIVATSALLWFDTVLTLPSECCDMWRRGFNLPMVIYLLTRYLAVIERVFFVLEPLLWNVSNEICGGITHTDDVLTILNYLSFSAFTCLRVYMVGRRDWLPFLLVVPLSLARPMILMIESAQYIPTQYGSPYGCGYIWNVSDSMLSNFSIISRAATIGADSIVIIVTWNETFWSGRRSDLRMMKGGRLPATKLMLRDGSAYFLVLLIIQVISITSNLKGHSLTIWLVWPYFDQVFTVILLSRLMLNLRRKLCHDDDRDEPAPTPSNVEFMFSVSNVFANLDAPRGPSPSTHPGCPVTDDSTPYPISPSHACGLSNCHVRDEDALVCPENCFELTERHWKELSGGQWETP